MSNTFSKIGKARNVEEFWLEVDNYYDVIRPNEDDKVPIAFICLKTMRLSGRLAKKHKNPMW